MAVRYAELLSEVDGVTLLGSAAQAAPVPWLFTVLLDSHVDRDAVMAGMLRDGIETRPVFHPLHILPPYLEEGDDLYPVSTDVGRRGLSLPTFAGMSFQQVDRVCASLAEHVTARVLTP